MKGTQILFSNNATKDVLKSGFPIWGTILDKLEGPDGTRYLTKVTDSSVSHAVDTTIVKPEEIEVTQI